MIIILTKSLTSYRETQKLTVLVDGLNFVSIHLNKRLFLFIPALSVFLILCDKIYFGHT